MAPSIEVWAPEGRFRVPLEDDRITLGNLDQNTIALGWDQQASRVYAVVEFLGGAWCIRDLDSTNGTSASGEGIWSQRPLKHKGAPAVPDLTPRERDVLVALCEPVLLGDVFTEPPSTRQVAETLVVTEAAVKQHLANLYHKFDIHDSGQRKRVRLANEAIQRRAVSVADLRKA